MITMQLPQWGHRGKMAPIGLNAAARLCETRKYRATISRFLLSE